MSALFGWIASRLRGRAGAGPGFDARLERLLRDEDPLVLRVSALEKSIRNVSQAIPQHRGSAGMGR